MRATRRKFLGLMGLAATAPVAAKIIPFIPSQPKAAVVAAATESINFLNPAAALARSMIETKETIAAQILNNAFIGMDDAVNK